MATQPISACADKVTYAQSPMFNMRRACFAGMVVIPGGLARTDDASFEQDRSAWNRAVMLEKGARDTLLRFRDRAARLHCTPVDVLDATWAVHRDQHMQALGTLLRTAAPDLYAVADKLALGISGGAFDGSDEGNEALIAILADIRTLVAGGSL